MSQTINLRYITWNYSTLFFDLIFMIKLNIYSILVFVRASRQINSKKRISNEIFLFSLQRRRPTSDQVESISTLLHLLTGYFLLVFCCRFSFYVFFCCCCSAFFSNTRHSRILICRCTSYVFAFDANRIRKRVLTSKRVTSY